jgi:hypothetical protein
LRERHRCLKPQSQREDQAQRLLSEIGIERDGSGMGSCIHSQVFMLTTTRPSQYSDEIRDRRFCWRQSNANGSDMSWNIQFLFNGSCITMVKRMFDIKQSAIEFKINVINQTLLA